MKKIRLKITLCIMAAILSANVMAQELPQINVSVKIVEFQTSRGQETGLSAFFKQRNETHYYNNAEPYGQVSSGNGAVTQGDITFPTPTAAGITVFVDRLTQANGDIEAVLQALVDQNRAFILSEPKLMVPVGGPKPGTIQTVEEVPYESTTVIGATAVQVTNFKPTGVQLTVNAQEVIDDDGDPKTLDDIYIKLNLQAQVDEEGQRITIALDDLVASGGGAMNAISVPEFISRSIDTTVWVRHGEVLILGGLYRNTKNKDVSTLPWLLQGEEVVNGMMQRLSPVSMPKIPLSSAIGSKSLQEGRRELVFLVSARLWRPSYIVSGDLQSNGEKSKKFKPTNVISDVLEGISDIPQGIAEGLSGESGGVSSDLGGESE